MLAGAVMVAPTLVACSHEKVQVAFRPKVGDSFKYELKVKSVTVTRMGTDPPERTVDEATLEATDTVLAATPEEVRVQVVLRRAGTPDRSFVVRFDRGAQLSGVETVEGLPPGVLGPLAFPEFLPAAAAAPPTRLLAPGDKWKIDSRPVLPGGVEAHFEGTGKLVKVKSSGGHKVASLESETRLPLVSSSLVGQITVALEGVETTNASATRMLSDGSVKDASSLTKGEFQVTLTGPGGEDAPPVTGTMTVEVQSETRRLP
jgi:polyisoprenoid-binding protein YceI